MRYLSYTASFALALIINTPVLAQSNSVDPFEIVSVELVSAEITKAGLSKMTTRSHKANGGDKRVFVYKSKSGLRVESMGPEKTPDWMSVNLGPARSKAVKLRAKKLESAFTAAYGTPHSLRGRTKSWDVPATSPQVDHAETTTVMLYLSKTGEQMLKLDRRKGGIGTPVVPRTVQKPPAPPIITAKSAPQTVQMKAPSQIAWDGQPD